MDMDDGLELRVVYPNSSRTFPLPPRGIVTLGRSTRADVQIEDPLVSRHHLQLHIEDEIFVEDVGSTQGTRLRGQALTKGERVALSRGEPVAIGTTVLTVEVSPRPNPPRLWPHTLFERRVAAECLDAGDTGRTFAVARVSTDVRLPFFGAHFSSLSSGAAAIVLAREAPPPIILGGDGPETVELLVTSMSPVAVTELMDRLTSAFRQTGLQVRSQVAWYPHDGRSAEVLLAPR